MKIRAKFSKKKIISILTALFILFQLILNRKSFNLKSFSPLPTATVINTISKIVKVTRVIDGDTIEIEGGQKVRYIGINAPEFFHDTNGRKTAQECFANEAYLENKRLVEKKTIRLEKDLSETDKYGRLLRYVYIPATNSGELFLNDYLVRQGYAKTMTVKPDTKFYPQLKQAEKEARENNQGLWFSCQSLGFSY